MIVGLTGGIGSGKSAVSSLLKARDITVVDADQAARDVVQKGCPALGDIAQHFGQHMLLASGELDRAALRLRVFSADSDPADKQWLEALLHPLIGQTIDQQLALAKGPYRVLESPLLLETTQHECTSFVVVVDCTEEQQVDRASIRDGNTEAQIRTIMANQLPRQQRLTKAHWVINNQSDMQQLEQQVQDLHEHLCQLTKAN